MSKKKNKKSKNSKVNESLPKDESFNIESNKSEIVDSLTNVESSDVQIENNIQQGEVIDENLSVGDVSENDSKEINEQFNDLSEAVDESIELVQDAEEEVVNLSSEILEGKLNGEVSSNNKIKVFMLFIIAFAFLIIGFILFRKNISFAFSDQDFVFDVGSNYSDPVIKACYGNRFKCKNIDVTIESDVDISTIGVYNVKYTAKYGKYKKTIVKEVSVVDKEQPVIEIESDSLSVCPNATEFNINYTATDNYDGDITSNVSKEVNDDSLVLSVADSSNNSISKTISLVREDLEAPVITLSGNQTVYLSLNSNYSESGYSAIDNCDGDLTSNVTVSGSVDTSKAGTYDIIYTVTDAFSNSTSVTRKVSVYSPNGDGSKVVYLTFDDGPSPYTGELLDILARYNVKATFFVTNRNPNYNHFIKRAFDEGHTIALHTSSHDYSRVYSSVDAYFNDLNEINETVKNITGSYSNLLRFPGGGSNTVSRKYSPGIMSTLSGMVEERGFKYFDWNVSSGDADGRSHSSTEYANNIINGLGNSSYYIVLQHDTNVNSIRSVGTVIEYGLSHGYTFKPLEYSSPTVHHKIAN